MSKRLNKRQQREQEELEQLRAVEKAAVQPEEEEEEEEIEEVSVEEEQVDSAQAVPSAEPVNAFAALGEEEEDIDDEPEEEEETAAPSTKKSKKKKPKKKKKKPAAADIDDEEETESGPSAATPSGKAKSKKGGKAQPVDDGMDEVDRALAELNMKAGSSSSGIAPAPTAAATATSSKALAFRQLLSVDPKNLDADAELKRFFGSKVISSSAAGSSKSHRATASTKLRYTISKPKPTYPPATSLQGLGMRELTEQEVEDVYASRLEDWRDTAEKWFTFEHAGVWRETTRQFLGATQSHDPNQLMALLQVYPWHVDTLLQMSEVYRLQSDIGAASEYAERALYALDRCLSPAFNVSSGACRLDFNAVENRPMFLATHRIIAYLGRRGCWVTAFNFAKLLFSLDPMNDPHGAAFWLDFLAIKSGNYEWILSMFEEHSEQMPVAVFQGYPGMAFAYALACRAREDAQKNKDRTASDQALREAVLAFPQAIIPIANKIGASIPDSVHSNSLTEIQAGYFKDETCAVHLLSRIYASRSEALWKEAPLISWFTKIVTSSLPDLQRPDAIASRQDVLRLIHTPRDPFDERQSIPLFMCRHVVCSESTSFAGFLPPVIRNMSISAFDPIPPSALTSSYNHAYFGMVQASSRRRGPRAAGVGQEGGGDRGMIEAFMGHVYTAMEANPAGWRQQLADTLRAMLRQAEPGGEGLDEAHEQELQMMLQLADRVAGQGGEGEGEGGMPGAFPGAPE